MGNRVAARHLGGAGGPALVPGRGLLRPGSRGGGRARGRARLGARHPGGRSRMRRRHLRDARQRAGRARRGDLHPGMHLNMLGADGPGKAEAEPEAVAALPALLRRMDAGEPRRRAHRRGRGRTREPRGRDRARCRPDRLPSGAFCLRWGYAVRLDGLGDPGSSALPRVGSRRTEPGACERTRSGL